MHTFKWLLPVLLAASCFPAFGQGASASRPFSDQSLWNSRPVQFKLGTTEVPKSDYSPTVAEGAYSVRVFVSRSSDPAVKVMGPAGSPGIWIADAEVKVPEIVIAHWPADVLAATGGDGHADIVDVAANRIHSFYQLKQENGQWRATQYTWSALDGRGWGDPAHYFQGSRATGVPTMAGLIRTSEVNDGKPSYTHALAMSMPLNGLSSSPAYIYPATAADIHAAARNTGPFPEGALMMLPSSFDVESLKTPALKKIARTLQSFGAYAVDQNDGTPFLIYVEIGSGFKLTPLGSWDVAVAGELDRMRAALRQVVSVTEWVDANGKTFTPQRNLNLLSMRGPWWSAAQGELGAFDSWQQAVIFPENGTRIVQTNASGRNMATVDWATPKPGARYRLKVDATKGATLQIDLVGPAGQKAYSSAALGQGAVVDFKWPAIGLKAVVTVTSGPQGGGKVSATLVAVDNAS